MCYTGKSYINDRTMEKICNKNNNSILVMINNTINYLMNRGRRPLELMKDIYPNLISLKTFDNSNYAVIVEDNNDYDMNGWYTCRINGLFEDSEVKDLTNTKCIEFTFYNP